VGLPEDDHVRPPKEPEALLEAFHLTPREFPADLHAISFRALLLKLKIASLFNLLLACTV
jgi:hypothetical protein